MARAYDRRLLNLETAEQFSKGCHVTSSLAVHEASVCPTSSRTLSILISFKF